MSDEVSGGAEAPAESASAPGAVAPPNPISTEGSAQDQAAEKAASREEPAKPVSARDALRKAAETVESRGKSEAKEPALRFDIAGNARPAANDVAGAYA